MWMVKSSWVNRLSITYLNLHLYWFHYIEQPARSKRSTILVLLLLTLLLYTATCIRFVASQTKQPYAAALECNVRSVLLITCGNTHHCTLHRSLSLSISAMMRQEISETRSVFSSKYLGLRHLWLVTCAEICVFSK